MGSDGYLDFQDDENKFAAVASKLGEAAKKGLAVAEAAIANVTSKLGEGITAGLQYNASVESYQTSFEIMAGSAGKAAEVMERLKKAGAETPLELPDLVGTTQLLMRYGLTADEAMGKLMLLGDVSEGSADKLSQIAAAYGQMSSEGEVQVEGIQQMIEAGFNPLQEISESTGESMDSLYDRVSKGTLSVDEIAASMERATSEGGKYYQAMEKQSETFNGLISTLKGNAQQLLGEVVQPISDSMVSTLLPSAIDAISQMAAAFQEQGVEGLIQAGGQVLSSLLTGIAQALPGIITVVLQIVQMIIENLTMNLPQLLEAGGQILMTLLGGIVQLIPMILSLGLNLVMSLLTGIVQGLPLLLLQGNEMITGYLSTIQMRFPEILQSGVDMINNLLSGLVNNAPQIISQAGQMLVTWIGIIYGMLPSIMQSGADIVLNLLGGLLRNAPEIISQAGQMLVGYIAAIASNLPAILQKGIEIIGQLLAGIIREAPSLLAAVPGIIAGIGSAFLDKDWLGIGRDIIAGIGSGIISAAGHLVSAAVDAARNAVNAVKGWLGIKSPSRLMRDEVGKYMALGMGIGFEKNVPTGDMAREIEASVLRLQNTAAAITGSEPFTVVQAVRNATSSYTDAGVNYGYLKKIFKEALDEANERPIELDGRQLARGLREKGFVQA